MSSKIPHILDRLYLVALALLMAFFAYQSYTPGFGLKTIRLVFEEAIRNMR